MEIQDVITHARDAMTVKSVFGEPYESGAVTVIAVASARCGARGGDGEDPPGEKEELRPGWE